MLPVRDHKPSFLTAYATIGLIVAIAAAWILLPGPAPASAATDAATLPAGEHAFTLAHGGRTRSYLVHVPRSLDAARPAPVMLALHGGGGQGAQFKRENGLDAVADRHGFIAAYPDGSGRFAGRFLTWNAGDHCCGWALEHQVDDTGFLAAVLADLSRRTPVDARRVYVTGHSNGAMMAYRFAAERADLVTAIVPVGGAMDLAEFRPSRPVAVLHIHSVDDPRALYAGGLGPPFPGTETRIHHEPAVPGIERWARFNGCRLPPVPGDTRRGNGRDRGQSAARLVYDGCGRGATVEHLKLTGVGHGWPGSDARRGMQRVLGPGTKLVNASGEAWAFASRHSR
ncbi:MAG: alpha/beta hydrolase family esterase [Gammaproteobacteria bacterium]